MNTLQYALAALAIALPIAVVMLLGLALGRKRR